MIKYGFDLQKLRSETFLNLFISYNNTLYHIIEITFQLFTDMNLCIFVKIKLNSFIIIIIKFNENLLIIDPTSNFNLNIVVYRVFVLCSFVWCFGHAAQYAPIDGVDANDCAVVLEGSKHFIYNSGKGSP